MKAFFIKNKISITLGTAIGVMLYTVGMTSNVTIAYEDLKNKDDWIQASITRLEESVDSHQNTIAENKAIINQLNVNQARILVEIENIEALLEEIRMDIKLLK